MHIAVCDDNFADRKQTERLLKKESDAGRSSGNILYVDSYGNVESLSISPMIYDLFLIDLTQTSPNGIETAHKLRELGVTALIVLCCSSIDYRSYARLPENVRFLDKPIKAAELSEILAYTAEQKKNLKPTIEIRGEQQTYYIHEEDILYATPVGHTVNVTLKDGTTIHQLGAMIDLVVAVNSFPCFMIVGNNICINVNHIREIQGNYLIMEDCSRIRLKLGDKKRIKQLSHL